MQKLCIVQDRGDDKRHTVGRILLQDQQMKMTSFFIKFQDLNLPKY